MNEKAEKMEELHQTNTLKPTGAPRAVPPQSVSLAAQESLGPQVLELSTTLQTTLELEQQIALVGQALQHELSIEGLSYHPPTGTEDIRFEQTEILAATYELTLEGRSLGTLKVYRGDALTEPDTRQLENLLCALMYPLRNALTYRQAVEMALRDPLTGAFNRRALDNALDREVELARRQHLPLSLIVIDIDHFKRINDAQGHAFGDDVLVTVAQTIANVIRRCDLLFRFGGEEFVVLASHATEKGAALLAERVRESIAAIRSVRGQDVRVTVSAGIADLHKDDDGRSLFGRADDALYQAKIAGRNRCVAAEADSHANTAAG